MCDILKAVDFMIKTANDNTHGYDQAHRNDPDYDCSSLVATALYYAGFNVSPYSWTGNLETQLRKCGFVDCVKPWKAGDIHLNTRHHVCMSINESKIAQASINENGKATGGKTGDQTGKEIYIRDYYEYSKGWDVHLRYIGTNDTQEGKKSEDVIVNEIIAGIWGNGEERKTALTKAGYDYNSIQKKVNEVLDYIFSGEDMKTNDEIAVEVIQGKWGNGEKRRALLTAEGYNYEDIQKIVNRMLS